MTKALFGFNDRGWLHYEATIRQNAYAAFCLEHRRFSQDRRQQMWSEMLTEDGRQRYLDLAARAICAEASGRVAT